MAYTTIDQIKKLYHSVYHIADDTIIDVILAITIGAKLKGDPIWLMIIGAPSAGKSELINMVSGVDYVHQVSNLTENSFLSGMSRSDGKEKSLLTKIGKRGMIIMKDYTSILSMKHDKREVIAGQMREIFDGKITKKTGNGTDPSWEGKINFIGGSTDKIFSAEGESAGMGRRNVNYVMPVEDDEARMAMGRTSRKNTNDIDIKRLQIIEAVKEFVEYKTVDMPDDLPQVDDEISEQLLELANFVTRVRTPTERDFKGMMKTVLFAEMPMRMSNQIHQLAQYFMYMNEDKLLPHHLEILFKISLDSIPKSKRLALEYLSQYDNMTTKAFAHVIKYPTDTAREWLEDLNVLGICSRQTVKETQTDIWKIDDKYRHIMLKYGKLTRIEEPLRLDSDVITGKTPYDYDDSDDIDPGWAKEVNERNTQLFNDMGGE